MSFEPHTFTPEELGQMEKNLELLGDREELIEWLENYSYFFADWSIIINEAVHERIAKKQKLGLPCEEEQEMLTGINFIFSKTAYFSGMLSDWHKELTFSKENAAQMVERGHP